MFAFSFCDFAKKKKRDTSFENEEGMKGNARSRLHLRKVVSMHGNIGGVDAHGIRNTVTYLQAYLAAAKRLPTVTEADVRRQRVLPARQGNSEYQ